MKTCSYCGKSYPDDHAVCTVDATPLEKLPDLASSQVAGVTAPPVSDTQKPAGLPVREALVTLAVLIVCLVAQKLPLPTLAKAAADHPPLITNSILVLGVQPVLSGFILVELAALLVPAWRPLRTGGRAGREKLRHASSIVGMFLALGQAFVVAVAFERTASYGAGFRILTILILLGATAALIALARVVDEAGLGGGFPILLLAFALPDVARPLGQAYSAVQHGALASSALQTGAFELALLVGATLWIFSPYCLPGNEPGDHPALVSRPACGVTPLSFAWGVIPLGFAYGVIPLSFVARLLVFMTPVHGLSGGQRLVLPWQVDVLQLVLSVLAAMGFAYLFNRPDRFSLVWKALSPLPPEHLPRIKPVMLECSFFIGLAMLVQVGLVHVLGKGHAPNVILIILVTGIIADLVREWRTRIQGDRLVAVWEIHQVYAVPPAMRLLQAQGFHPFAKGLRLRSLLQFFGPYAPVLVLVPAQEAQAAYALLESRWPMLDLARC